MQQFHIPSLNKPRNSSIEPSSCDGINNTMSKSLPRKHDSNALSIVTQGTNPSTDTQWQDSHPIKNISANPTRQELQCAEFAKCFVIND